MADRVDTRAIVDSFSKVIVPSIPTNTHGRPKDLNLDNFLVAYAQLVPVIKVLGSPFYFVEQDIVAKIEAIRRNKLHNKDEEFTENLLDFVKWEIDTNRARTKDSTSRHLLRLIRALLFINIFMDKLNDVTQEVKPVAKTAYDSSLSKHHSWGIRKSVSLAFYTLPTRKSFMSSLQLDQNQENIFRDVVDSIREVYDILDVFYQDNEITDLP